MLIPSSIFGKLHQIEWRKIVEILSANLFGFSRVMVNVNVDCSVFAGIKNVRYRLGHGLINRIKMALKPQKYARKRTLDGLVAHSRALTQQIAAVLSSKGYDQISPLRRCKSLKTGRFPADLRLVTKKFDSYHIDPVYEFMT